MWTQYDIKHNVKRHDTRITLHSIENDIDKIVVQSRDTDVLVVLLDHYHKMPSWLKAAMGHII